MEHEMKRTILGYFYRKSTETPKQALKLYTGDNTKFSLHKSEEEVARWVEYDKNAGIVGKSAKPKFLRLVIEEFEVESE